jgi:hypothetical protein
MDLLKYKTFFYKGILSYLEIQYISKIACSKSRKNQIKNKTKQKIVKKSQQKSRQNQNMICIVCSNLQIKKLKCRGITPVYYDMRKNLGYIVTVAFFSRENILPKKVSYLIN